MPWILVARVMHHADAIDAAPMAGENDVVLFGSAVVYQPEIRLVPVETVRGLSVADIGNLLGMTRLCGGHLVIGQEVPHAEGAIRVLAQNRAEQENGRAFPRLVGFQERVQRVLLQWMNRAADILPRLYQVVVNEQLMG